MASELQDARLAVILLAPLLGAAVAYLSGAVSHALSGVIASLAVFASFVMTVLVTMGIGDGSAEYTLASWISGQSFSMPLALYFDHLTAVMCLVITGIGTLIHVYSVGYMAEDESRPRFFSYLNLFVASMLLLVLGKSLPVVFIGWEGVGLCSYLLIGFWFTNREYASAGRKAFVMNRIGDAGFLIAMMVLFSVCGTLDIPSLGTPENLAKLAGGFGLIAGLALFLAATGKSAQIPLFTWLPDAMAGPTAVSALIHAATMVTAGVYLMARMGGVVESDEFVPALITWTALATAFLAATVAMAQNDIKKVLAYSTVSQLGFMFLAVGVGAYWVALFHVVTHAFFKACLFLSAGSVIHGCHHEQDMRQMGGLAKSMPLTCASYGLATIAIAGVWPLAGFFSKHGILDSVSATPNALLLPYSGTIVGVGTLVAVMTAFYMARSFVLTFLGGYRGHAHPHEVSVVMWGPVAVLAVLSVCGGYYLNGSLEHYLAPVLRAPDTGAAHHALNVGGIISGSLPGLLGLGIAVALFSVAPAIKETIRGLVWPFERLFSNKWYVDELYNALVVKPLGFVSDRLYRSLDLPIVDGSVVAVGYVSRAMGEIVRRTATGQVATYVILMFVATGVILGIFISR